MNDETRFYYDQAIAAQRRMEGLEVELAQLRRVRVAAERVVAKYREEDPWIDPTQLFEEIVWLGDALDQHASERHFTYMTWSFR